MEACCKSSTLLAKELERDGPRHALSQAVVTPMVKALSLFGQRAVFGPDSNVRALEGLSREQALALVPDLKAAVHAPKRTYDPRELFRTFAHALTGHHRSEDDLIALLTMPSLVAKLATDQGLGILQTLHVPQNSEGTVAESVLFNVNHQTLLKSVHFTGTDLDLSPLVGPGRRVHLHNDSSEVARACLPHGIKHRVSCHGPWDVRRLPDPAAVRPRSASPGEQKDDWVPV
ncbi:hypothetical protein [Ramlibacter sp.]|uniref:hypothetical protein n=1 Tax=Ramlibacter sp. TaxID=1917967 RepID=UPI003D0A7B5C